jgi:uncharacterized protein (DUF433 family)
MRFSVDWIDGGVNGGAEERATLCDLRIYVSDQNACRFVDFVSNEDAEPLVVPAVHLAEGLATDWWRIFGGRDREHRIQRYRTGFALPDLSFRADGSMFEVTGRSFYSRNPHLRFPFAGEETLPRGAAESTLSRFIEKVVERLAGEGVRNSEVALCWSRVAESRSDPDEQAFCEASGALGLDPYAISEDDARFIERASRVFSQEPLIEFLAGFTRKERTVSVPDFVDQVESRPAEQSSLPELGHVASQIAHLIRYHRDDHPWAIGYRAARAFRDALGAGSDHRFASHAILARKLGSTMFEPVKLFSGVRALVSRPDGGTRIHLHDHRRDSRSADAGARSTNFAFARAVGDTVCFLDTRRSVINDLHHAERQATGRAFAAEFLAPVESIVDVYEAGYDAEEIADEFDVSSYVIEDQMRNQDRIRGACHTLN